MAATITAYAAAVTAAAAAVNTASGTAANATAVATMPDAAAAAAAAASRSETCHPSASAVHVAAAAEKACLGPAVTTHASAAAEVAAAVHCTAPSLSTNAARLCRPVWECIRGPSTSLQLARCHCPAVILSLCLIGLLLLCLCSGSSCRHKVEGDAARVHAAQLTVERVQPQALQLLVNV